MLVSLRSKLVLSTGLLLAGLVFAFAAVAGHRVGAFVRERTEEKAGTLARGFAAEASLGTALREEKEFESKAGVLRADGDVLAIEVRASNGDLLYRWTAPGVPPPDATPFAPPPSEAPLVRECGAPGTALEAVVRILPLASNMERSEVERIGPDEAGAGPAPLGGGAARIVLSLAGANRETRLLLAALGAAAFVIVGLGAALALLLGQALTRPLRALTRGAEAIGRGEPGSPIAIRSRDELGALARAFEEMEARLADSRARLEAYNQDLEREVDARTEELRRAYEDLKRIDELKDAFVSSVSHEFRTPLTSIRSYAELLIQYPPDDPRDRLEFLAIIKNESERLTRLIEEVLDLSKIESGSVRWRIEPISLDDVVSHAVATVRPLYEEAGIALETRFEPGVPLVLGDSDRLVQVVTNLLSNARKWGPRGTRVEVSIERVGSELRCGVRDEGSGIPKDLHQVIFEKFKQVNDGADPLTGKPRGTGLGLTISREIVQALGGRIWVESTPGRGSAFYFTVPVAAPGAVAAAAAGGAGADRDFSPASSPG